MRCTKENIVSKGEKINKAKQVFKPHVKKEANSFWINLVNKNTYKKGLL